MTTKNDARASWAGEALDRFMAVTGTDPPDAVMDLLADLMHWCDRHDMNFYAALRQAREHYHHEVRYPEED